MEPPPPATHRIPCQDRICRYLGPNCRHRHHIFQDSPLLILPPHVRERIYRHVGLTCWWNVNCILHAGQLKTWPSDIWGFKDDERRRDLPTYRSLLLSCRAIYTELAPLLYSSLHIILYYSLPSTGPYAPPPGSKQVARTVQHRTPLHTLRVLTTSSLQALTSLKIVLNEAGCHELCHSQGLWCCDEGPVLADGSTTRGVQRCDKYDRGRHQPPLLSPAAADDDAGRLRAARAVVREWQEVADRLFTHIPPGRLALAIVADIHPAHEQAMEIANGIAEPLLRLPRSFLRELHLRLSRTAGTRLQCLAQEVVTHASGLPTPSLTPPTSPNATTLTTLPRELRLRILEYTDLVTPNRQVIWSRQLHAYLILNSWTDIYDAPWNRFFNCWDEYAWGFKARPSYDHRPPPHSCFCTRRHSAFSVRCQCWAPPGPRLFLICRKLHEDAQYVFFSSNRIIVHDHLAWDPFDLRFFPDGAWPGPWWEDPLPESPYPFERLAISQFLRDVIPVGAIKYIRFLELGFPFYRPGTWPDTEHPAMQDWWSTAQFLADHANLEGLTLRVKVIRADYGRSSTPFSYFSLTPEGADRILTAILDIVRPFRGLGDRGLAMFYANIQHPVGLTEEGYRVLYYRDARPSDWVNPSMVLSNRVECEVMGERYDS
ncbi:hypothetical protein VTJ49DRAFT_7667 [Mycothermus thermophilus]|uniref:F-box domain-containing protein n=1 Tax=Humicola insolens TaxID=85995 RepID=A0ABR3VGC3_HUMIN